MIQPLAVQTVSPAPIEAAEPCPQIELLIPIYNEAHVLEDSLGRLKRRLEGLELPSWKIVIVDNGSTDGSRMVGEKLARADERVGYHRLRRKGRGLALRRAWSETAAEFSIYMDVDLSTGLEAVPEAVRLLQGGADVVVGSRLHRDARIERSPKREILSRGYNLLIRLLFPRRRFEDAQCGFKGIRVATVRGLLPFVQNNHWFFDTELLLLAESAGLEVKSIPVTWLEDTDTRVKIASTVWQDLKGLARVRRTLRTSVRAWRLGRVA